ncbi:DUF6297 family protein [Hamadaea tsunoensis]|uniref:DUF6297 family protein n=1 Tax=Hamadaea tsunoensis TaxID=53368 RepID=UPI0003FF1B6F|nr:DUF6297 family protein [Hamadaea tsunoensis]
MSATGDVRRWLRRKRRHNTAERLYTTLLALVIGVPTLVSAAGGALRRLDARHLAHAMPPAPSALLALGLLWYALCLAAALRLGPVTSSAATVTWLATSPLDRRRLLLPAAGWVLGAGALAGGLYGTVGAFGLALPAAPAVAFAAACAALGVTLAALLICVQTGAYARWGEFVIVLLVAASAVVTVLRPALPSDVDVPWLPFAVAAAICGALAVWRLGRLRWLAFAGGTRLAATIAAGVVTLDPGLAARVFEEQRGAALHPRRTGFGTALGWRAVVRQDLLSAVRAPERWTVFAATAVVPATAAQILGTGVVLAVVWLLCGVAGIAGAGANIRRDHDQAALPRLLGLRTGVLTAARAVVPVLVGTLWTVLSLALVDTRYLVWGVLAGPALATGMMRAARRGRVRHEFPPIVTPAGLIPTGILHWAIRGVDLAALLLAPTLVVLSGGSLPLLAQAAGSVVGLALFLRRAARP